MPDFILTWFCFTYYGLWWFLQEIVNFMLLSVNICFPSLESWALFCQVVKSLGRHLYLFEACCWASLGWSRNVLHSRVCLAVVLSHGLPVPLVLPWVLMSSLLSDRPNLKYLPTPCYVWDLLSWQFSGYTLLDLRSFILCMRDIILIKQTQWDLYADFWSSGFLHRSLLPPTLPKLLVTPVILYSNLCSLNSARLPWCTLDLSSCSVVQNCTSKTSRVFIDLILFISFTQGF